MPGQAGNLIRQATRLHNRGNLPEALELYTRALAHSPREINALISAAECLTHLSGPRDAAPLYLRAVEAHASEGNLLKALFTLHQISPASPQRQLGTRLLAERFAKKTGRAAQLREPPISSPHPGPGRCSVPLFSQLSKNAFTGLVDSLQTRTAAEGESLLRQGDPGDAMLILVSGRLDVFRDTGDKTAVSVQTLEAGSFFGERSLLGGLPRAASVRATQPSSLLVVSRSQVEQTRRAYPSWERALHHVYRDNLLSNLMRTSDLFAPLPGEAKRRLLKQFRLKRLPPRTQLFEEGQPPDGLYVVLEGRVEVVVRQRGRRRVLAQWESGAVFGEESLFGSPRASAHGLKTSRKTTVLRLPRKSFTEVLAGFPNSWPHVQNLAASCPAPPPGGEDSELWLLGGSDLILI